MIKCLLQEIDRYNEKYWKLVELELVSKISKAFSKDFESISQKVSKLKEMEE